MKRLVYECTIIFVLLFSQMNSSAEALVLFYNNSVHTYSGNIYSLKVNGEITESDIPPIMDDRIPVPVRAVFEKLGATVGWDNSENRITISMKNNEIDLKVGSRNAIVNKNNTVLDVPAMIINNRTVVLCLTHNTSILWCCMKLGEFSSIAWTKM